MCCIPNWVEALLYDSENRTLCVSVLILEITQFSKCLTSSRASTQFGIRHSFDLNVNCTFQKY